MKRIPDSYRALAEALLEKTLRGELSWSEPSRGTFSVTWADRSVNVWSWTDVHDIEDSGFAIGIRDGKGEMIDSFAAGPSDEGYALLEDLYANVRRRSRDIDSTISEILVQLR